MKKWHYYCIIAGLIFALGFLTGLLIRKTNRIIETVEVKVKDTLIVEKWREKTCYDTIYAEKIVYIDSTTPIGNIPIRTEQFSGSFSIFVNKQRCDIKYAGEFEYRGIAYGYTLRPVPADYTINFVQPGQFPIRPYLSLSAYYTFLDIKPLENIGGDIELGLKISSVKLFLGAGYYKAIIPKAGVKYEKNW